MYLVSCDSIDTLVYDDESAHIQVVKSYDVLVKSYGYFQPSRVMATCFVEPFAIPNYNVSFVV